MQDHDKEMLAWRGEQGMSGVSRRTALRFAAGGLASGALALLAACAGSATPRAPTAQLVQTPSTTAAPKSGGPALPTFMPSRAATPDLPSTGDGIDPGYITYPGTNPSSVAQTPGRGGDVSVATVNLGKPMQPLDQNPQWQEINRQLGANLNVLAVPIADWPTRLATLVAGNDLPDILYAGAANIQNFPDFLKAKCQDLTPFVSGAAIKDYPNLAALPTRAWKGQVYNDAIYAVPNVINYVLSWGMYVHQELLDDVGASPPTSADDFTRLLQALNRPQAGLSAITSVSGSGLDVTNGLYPSMFGAPNNWRIEPNGSFTRSYETEEYKASVGYARDLYAAGVFSPTSVSNNVVSSRLEFAGRKAAMRWEGWNGTGTILIWDAARTVTPPSMVRYLAPFPAKAGGKPVYYFGRGSGGPIALKQAPPERIRELLRILDYFAAPFGTREHLLLRYGVKDIDYTLDDQGNPVLTDKGQVDTTPVWQYVATAPQVLYYTKDPQFAPVTQAAEKPMVAAGIEDPTVGLYSPTDSAKSPSMNRAFYDGVTDIVLARRPLIDYDQLVSDWRSSGGNQIRTEYAQAQQRARA